MPNSTRVGAIIVPISEITYDMDIREIAAKYVYLADLTLNDETSVTEIINMMEAYGQYIAETYYLQGKTDTILGKPKDRLFEKKSLNSSNKSS